MVLGCAGVVHDLYKKIHIVKYKNQNELCPILCANNFMYILFLNQKYLKVVLWSYQSVDFVAVF